MKRKLFFYFSIVILLITQISCFSWTWGKGKPYLNVPFCLQEKANYCGCACVQMWLAYNNIQVTQDQVYEDCYHVTTPAWLCNDSLRIRSQGQYGHFYWKDWDCTNAQSLVIAAAITSIHHGQPAMIPIHQGTHMLLAIGFRWHNNEVQGIPIADGMYFHDPLGPSFQFMSADELYGVYFTPAQGTYQVVIDNVSSIPEANNNLEEFISMGGTYYGAPSKFDPNTYQTLSISSSSITSRGNRRPPKSMKDLTDPTSPSYVPIPYPKNRKEIIDDLKYGIDVLFNHPEESSYIDDNAPEIEKILLNFLNENSIYSVGKIEKVKNYSESFSHDYSWLIFLENIENKDIARITMHADGLIGGGASTISSQRSIVDKPQQEILKALSDATGNSVSSKDIEQMERVSFSSPLAQQISPMWEIKIKNQLYYYCTVNDIVYEIDHKIPWKKEKNGLRQMIKSLVPDTNDFVPDSINDEILVFKKTGK